MAESESFEHFFEKKQQRESTDFGEFAECFLQFKLYKEKIRANISEEEEKEAPARPRFKQARQEAFIRPPTKEAPEFDVWSERETDPNKVNKTLLWLSSYMLAVSGFLGGFAFSAYVSTNVPLDHLELFNPTILIAFYSLVLTSSFFELIVVIGCLWMMLIIHNPIPVPKVQAAYVEGGFDDAAESRLTAAGRAAMWSTFLMVMTVLIVLGAVCMMIAMVIYGFLVPIFSAVQNTTSVQSIPPSTSDLGWVGVSVFALSLVLLLVLFVVSPVSLYFADLLRCCCKPWREHLKSSVKRINELHEISKLELPPPLDYEDLLELQRLEEAQQNAQSWRRLQALRKQDQAKHDLERALREGKLNAAGIGNLPQRRLNLSKNDALEEKANEMAAREDAMKKLCNDNNVPENNTSISL